MHTEDANVPTPHIEEEMHIERDALTHSLTHIERKFVHTHTHTYTHTHTHKEEHKSTN
jgi:hypothetical protein